MGLDYEVQYKKGAENRVVDALSRQQGDSLKEEGQLNAISMTVPLWVQDITTSYEGDSMAMELITQLTVDTTGPKLWQYLSGVLRRKGKVYVGSTGNLRQQLIQTFHASNLGGHSGQLGTLKRLSLLFHWPLMKHMVVHFVSEW